MKRRDYFKSGAVAAVGIPMLGKASEDQGFQGERAADNWYQVADGECALPIRKKRIQCDVAVLGGGLAGICAAVAAARNGARTVLVQDRPVLGGNSSSEMRVHVNGVNHLRPDNYAERETGIIEELLLHNRFHNKQESWPVWDHLLYDFVISEPNLELLLNTQATKAIMDGSTIQAAKCWQLTTETEIIIEAEQFIDCSGDGLLAATSGALYRTGREGKKEFGEKFAPDEPDGWQMGATLLMHSEDMGKPMPFEAPSWAIPYDVENQNPKRNFNGFHNGLWWMEVGSDADIIGEQEEIRHKLMGYAYGVWDYLKNHSDIPGIENHALTWVQSLPGKRESRRFIGDYILREGDLTGHTHFKDTVGYGGWSLDEHCWAGIENLEDPPSYFHYHFHKVYEIPYRSLYSKNITNLSFAGRNISQTHIALSSTRLMATCSTMGMAVGTAAAMCIHKHCNPRDIAQKHINALQENLLREDSFLPHRPARDEKDLARKAALIAASSTVSGDAALLNDGVARDFEGVEHGWESHGLPAEVIMEWEEPINLSKVEIKCDTNLKRNICMRKDSKVSFNYWNDVPVELLKSLDVEARVNGKWVKVGSNHDNRRRLIKFDFDPVRTSGIRINLKETYGAPNAKLFEVRCYEA
ncbi:FAD-dependent oxidoreductase [Pontiella sp. NLcol2]|uniref:FAD-dependent oxidoreductase n=2 Tax=Pontiella agarivorans TaxID=3038953 RepID=A0ABU5MTR9_9BACT|nr:FAD-dependent oxidoreductase [Pontiella agarivorans]